MSEGIKPPPLPKQPTTVEMPRPPDWAISLTEKVSRGFATVNGRLDALSENVEILQHDAKDTKARIGRLERRADDMDARATTASMRARSASEVDAKHDAAIAHVVTKVSALEEKTDDAIATLAHLRKVTEHPMVRRVAYLVGLALLSYLTAKGIR